MVQVAGSALRVPARECRHLAETNHEFSLAGLKMAELLLAESRRSVYCHTTHGGLERFARLLAESADRSGGRAKLQLTQEVLAAMLGMQRPSVTRFAQELKRLDSRSGQAEARRVRMSRLHDAATIRTWLLCSPRLQT